MIQRIQSLYLLLASLFTGSLFFTELARFLYNGSVYVLKYNGLFNIANSSNVTDCATSCMTLALLAIITTLSLFATIFIYKKRMMQLRLCKINLILLGGLIGAIGYRCFDAKATLEKLDATSAQISFSWTLIFPVIAIILVLLAMKGISKDEALVKSLDRIR